VRELSVLGPIGAEKRRVCVRRPQGHNLNIISRIR
jgi:hypothetical protein